MQNSTDKVEPARFAHKFDEFIDDAMAAALGRLSVSFQVFENTLADLLRTAFAEIASLEKIESLTSNRKIEEGRKVLKTARGQFAIRPVRFKGRFPLLMNHRTASDAMDDCEQAFAALDGFLLHTGKLLNYRNSFIHGRLDVREGKLTFVGKKGVVSGSTAEFTRKKQEVLATAFTGLLAAQGVRAALEYLTREQPVER